jgi:hypothetical protein
MKRSTRSPSDVFDAPADIKPTSALLAKLDAYDPVLHGTPSPSPEPDDGSDYWSPVTASPAPKKRKAAGGSGTPSKPKVPKVPKVPKASPAKSPRTPTKAKSSASGSGSPGSGLSPKAHYAMLIWEAGVKALNKADVQNEVSGVR